MPSNAYDNHLVVLLRDARELTQAHERLRTGLRGRQWELGALNRAVVVMSVSAWEAYIEEVLREAIIALRPVPPAALGNWSALFAAARSQIGRFNTPNVQNVRGLISDFIGLADVTDAWSWRNCVPQQARDLLADALQCRHQIAHGVNPRPVVHNNYARWLPPFFMRLGLRTDRAVREYLINTLGVANPWPA